MPVTNEDLLAVIKTMHADLQTRVVMLDGVVRQHEVKLAVIDKMMETFDSLGNTLRTVTERLKALETITEGHSANWEKVWKYGLGVLVVGVVAAVLGLVFVK